MIVEDINSIYGPRNASKAQIYTLAGYQESNALDVCVQIQKHLSSISFISAEVVKKKKRQTRSRCVSFDCFIVMPVFSPHTAASQLSALPRTIHSLMEKTELDRGMVMSTVIHTDTSAFALL